MLSKALCANEAALLDVSRKTPGLELNGLGLRLADVKVLAPFGSIFVSNYWTPIFEHQSLGHLDMVVVYGSEDSSRISCSLESDVDLTGPKAPRAFCPACFARYVQSARSRLHLNLATSTLEESPRQRILGSSNYISMVYNDCPMVKWRSWHDSLLRSKEDFDTRCLIR